MKRKILVSLLLSALAIPALALPFAKGDAETGSKIFDQHACNSCHANMLGGDGNTMFTRAERKVKTPASLTTQINRCSTNLGLMLFEDDEENIAAHLNKNYYKFK